MFDMLIELILDFFGWLISGGRDNNRALKLDLKETGAGSGKSSKKA